MHSCPLPSQQFCSSRSRSKLRLWSGPECPGLPLPKLYPLLRSNEPSLQHLNLSFDPVDAVTHEPRTSVAAEWNSGRLWAWLRRSLFQTAAGILQESVHCPQVLSGLNPDLDDSELNLHSDIETY